MSDRLRDRMISKAPARGFPDVHRSHTRNLRVGPDLPPSGGSDGIESVWIRCRQCGYPVDTSKTVAGSPYGNDITIQTYRSVTVNM